jgi:hypothetical protein
VTAPPNEWEGEERTLEGGRSRHQSWRGGERERLRELRVG